MNITRTKSILATVLVLGVGAYFYFPAGGADERIEYTTATVSKGNLQNLVVTTGSLKAVGTVEVGSQISGQISELFVDFNSEVKTGDLLARLDSRTYEGRVKQAEASLEIAKASVIQQDASLARAESDLGEAKRLLERQRALSKAGHISASELDRLETALRSAEAQVTIVRAQVINAKASVKQAEASLFQARIDLERCTIRSPVDGVVINRAIELGQTVAASMSAPVLFTIAQDLNEMQVEASVDEADIGKVKMDQAANFTVEAFPERRYRGRIKQVRKAATELQNVVTYTVIVSADNRDGTLLPGMTATIEVVTGEKNDVLRVPNTALRFKPPGFEEKQSDPRTTFMEARIRDMKQQLNLSAEQEQGIRKLFEERMANMPSPQAGGGGFGGGFPPGPPPEGPRRQGMFDNEQMRQILSEQQYEEFRRLAREGGNARRLNNADRPRPGAVWVMTAAGKLEQRQLLTGLAGDEFTEVINGDLAEGDKVVVRAVRRQTN